MVIPKESAGESPISSTPEKSFGLTPNIEAGHPTDDVGSHDRSASIGGGGRMVHWGCLILIILLALWLRMDDLLAWERYPSKAFYHNEPLLITFDGYYYLSLARDLQEGAYDAADRLRGVPEAQSRPWPPPLISMLAAAASSAFSISLNWTAILLPPILGLALAVPLYLFGRFYGGPMMSLVATCVGLCSNYYVYRSNLGWFDTDCLNVTFALFIAYAFIRFGLKKNGSRFLYLAAGMAASGIFLLWWDQARALVSLMVLLMLVLVLLFYYRPMGRERYVFVLVVLSILSLLILWRGPRAVTRPFKDIQNTIYYVFKKQVGTFPSTSPSVFEQKRAAAETLVEKTTGHHLTFAIGIIGLVWMAVHHKRKILPLMLWLAIGCCALLFARRFLIFLNPFFALGLGFVIQRLWDLKDRNGYLKAAVPICTLLVCLYPVKTSFAKVYWPKEIPPIISGFDALSRQTSPDAVIWAWWDHGYPLRYWARRATVNDGSLHSGIRTVCNAIPMAADSQQLSANFIHFYAARGLEGMHRVFNATGNPHTGMQWIKRILKAGPERAAALIAEAGLSPAQQWHDFFFPPEHRELYLFLDHRMARTTYWWYWFGTWDVEKQKGIRGQFRIVHNVHVNTGTVRGDELEADLAGGMVIYQQKRYPLIRSYITDGRDQTRTTYDTDRGLVLSVHSQARTAAIMDQGFSKSTFNRLYGLTAPDPAYFTLMEQRYPYYQIWKVTPDP